MANELIETANYKGKTSARHPHDWLDDNGANPWDEWTVYVQDKNKTVWEATLHIANTTDGEKILYDIDPIKMVEQRGTSRTSTTNAKIPQSANAVNSKFSAPATDSEGNALSEMVKTGISDIPNLAGLKSAIQKKQSLNDFLADLQEIRKAYVQDASQNETAFNNIVQLDGAAVNRNVVMPVQDSAGNALSEGQQEYFKDSKVRDEADENAIYNIGEMKERSFPDVQKALRGSSTNGGAQVGTTSSENSIREDASPVKPVINGQTETKQFKRWFN